MALLVAVNDPTTGQVVRAQLYNHAVLWKDADIVLAHFARYMGKYPVAVGQLNAEHCVGQSFDYSALDLDDTVFFGHSLFVAKYIDYWSCGGIVAIGLALLTRARPALQNTKRHE